LPSLPVVLTASEYMTMSFGQVTMKSCVLSLAFAEGGQRFLDSVLGGTFARRNLAHPDLTAACAAAERVLAVARHFVEFHAEQFKQLARSGESAVVASEIARVVEGDFVIRQFILDRQVCLLQLT
jgi:hypothetical protein